MLYQLPNRSPARKALVCAPDVAQGLALLAQRALLFLATLFASFDICRAPIWRLRF